MIRIRGGGGEGGGGRVWSNLSRPFSSINARPGAKIKQANFG